MALKAILFVATFAVVAILIGIVSAENLRPIVGIMTEPLDPEMKQWGGKSFIAASYVKYIESAGARVVPVPFDAPESELQTLFNSLNGLLVPGGDVDIETSPFYPAVKFFVNSAIEAAKQGDWFPIHGTCLGFQTLNVIVSGDQYNLLTRFDSENISLSLDFTSSAPTSRMFGNAPAEIMKILASQDVTMNNHHYGISTSNFAQNTRLTSFFRLLSTNVDRAGLPFVSAVEGINAPIYGTQFHPEKPMFEWMPGTAVNHDADSIVANQYFANFLVDEARKSNHSFASLAAETAALIYNYNATYTLGPESYTQCYFFDF